MIGNNHELLLSKVTIINEQKTSANFEASGFSKLLNMVIFPKILFIRNKLKILQVINVAKIVLVAKITKLSPH